MKIGLANEQLGVRCHHFGMAIRLNGLYFLSICYLKLLIMQKISILIIFNKFRNSRLVDKMKF